MPKAALASFFRARDVDGSGALDRTEFKALTEDVGLFRSACDHKQAIVHLGLCAKREAAIAERFLPENLWKLGLPLEKPVPEVGERPSLADVSNVQSLVLSAVVAGKRLGGRGEEVGAR